MSKVIQIAVTGVQENPETQCEALIFALTDDGKILMTNNRYIKNSDSDDWKDVTPVEPAAAQKEVE